MADEILVRVARGIEHGQRGERAQARRVLQDVWTELGPDGDALHRCAVAHSLADVQDDLHDELTWDLRALAAAASLTDAQLEAASMLGSAHGLYPSLHLNLADVYRRLGEHAFALDHVGLGLAALERLPPDGYLDEIRRSLERIERAVARPKGTRPPPVTRGPR